MTALEKSEISISIRLNKNLLNELDNTATLLKLKRSQFIRNLLDTGLEEIGIFDSIRQIKPTIRLNKIEREKKNIILEAKSGKQERKKWKKIEGINITIWLTKKIVFDLDESSKEMNLSRNELIEGILEVGMIDTKILRNTGLLKLAVKIRDHKLTEKIKDIWKKKIKQTDRILMSQEIN